MAEAQEHEHAFVDTVLTLDLVNSRCWRLDFDERVMRFAVFLNAVSKIAKTPIFSLAGFAAEVFKFTDSVRDKMSGRVIITCS